MLACLLAWPNKCVYLRFVKLSKFCVCVTCYLWVFTAGLIGKVIGEIFDCVCFLTFDSKCIVNVFKPQLYNCIDAKMDPVCFLLFLSYTSAFVY